jgi:Domain of unknown function (DUF4062)
VQLTIPVFISSKQSELAIERDLVAESVRRMPPLDPVIAEEWAPQAKKVQTVMLDKVRLAPVYVGLFASVYSEPTELEYREAVRNPYREVLLYVKATADRDPRLAVLLERMRDDHVITTYDDVRDLLRRFSDHLREAMSRMILLLQKLGEERPISRSAGSRLFARWEQQQRFLQEFAFGALAGNERRALVEELSRPGKEVFQ